jgi:hypothetical protein
MEVIEIDGLKSNSWQQLTSKLHYIRGQLITFIIWSNRNCSMSYRYLNVHIEYIHNSLKYFNDNA